MELPVVNQSGETVSQVELDEGVFGVPMNHSLVHQVVVAYQANKRQGTHDTKTRGEVSGGGRKALDTETYRPGRDRAVFARPNGGTAALYSALIPGTIGRTYPSGCGGWP